MIFVLASIELLEKISFKKKKYFEIKFGTKNTQKNPTKSQKSQEPKYQKVWMAQLDLNTYMPVKKLKKNK
jgi:hypothetical protein